MPGSYNQLTQQPAVRIDYQVTREAALLGESTPGSGSGRYVQPGLLPGFNDAYMPYPNITNYGAPLTT